MPTTKRQRQPSAHNARRNVKVSANSHFDDDVWIMDGWRPGGNMPAHFRWHWDFLMADGSRFTDAQWAPLLLSAKRYILSLREDPPLGRRPISTLTMGMRYRALRVLLAWMDRQGFRRFEDVDRDACERFLEVIAQRPGKTRKRVSQGTVMLYQWLLSTLYVQGPKIGGGIAANPWPRQGRIPRNDVRLRSLAGSQPYTPDAIAVPLIASAIRLIGQPADDVARLQDRAQQHYDKVMRNDMISSGKAAIATRPIVSRFRFSTLEGEDHPWCDLTPGSTKDVRALANRISEACFVVIIYLTGMRISEILHLTVGCVIDVPSSDGNEVFQYVEGRIFKHAPTAEGQLHRWIAPEPVVRAVHVMERLSMVFRQRTNDPRLFQTMRTLGLIGPDTPPSASGAGAWNDRLTSRFAPFIDLPTHNDRQWRLTSHQGRKTFARFVGKRDRTGLHALQKHLGHVTRVMTDAGYVGTDFELTELVDKETLHHTHSALEELITSSRLAGPAGRRIAARSPFRGRTVTMEVSAYVDWILKETDMRLGVCDWGFCVYRRDSSACQGNEKGPNEVLRTESICVGCPNFALTDQHAPFWKARLDRNKAILERKDLDSSSRELATSRVAESRRILSELGNE